MKLSKIAVALVVAGAAVAPVAHADVTLSGYVGIILGGSDADPVRDPDTGLITSEPGELAFSSDDSTLNVAASHELNNGLTGYGNWRVDLGLSNDGSASADNIYVGFKGDFGDIRIGEVPDAVEFGQVAGDILSDIGGEDRGISYTGSFGSATVGLNWSPVGSLNGETEGGGSDKIAAGVKFNAGGFGIGLGFANHDELTQMSAGATFSFAGASVGVAFKDFDNDRQTIGAKASWAAGDISLGLTYEADQGDVGDDSKIRFDAGYDLGGDMNISTRVNVLDSATDVTDYRVLFAKSF